MNERVKYNDDIALIETKLLELFNYVAYDNKICELSIDYSEKESITIKLSKSNDKWLEIVMLDCGWSKADIKFYDGMKSIKAIEQDFIAQIESLLLIAYRQITISLNSDYDDYGNYIGRKAQ